MTLEFPGRRSGFVHDIAVGDRVVPIDAETRDSELSEIERKATREVLKRASDAEVDATVPSPWERNREQGVVVPAELEDTGILTEEQSDAVKQALFPSSRAKRIGQATARRARREQ